jgi:hypothetical protein
MIRQRLVGSLFVIVRLSIGAAVIWHSQRHSRPDPPPASTGGGPPSMSLTSQQPNFNYIKPTARQRSEAMHAIESQLQAIHRGDFQTGLSYCTDAMISRLGPANHFKTVIAGPHGRYPGYSRFASVSAAVCAGFAGTSRIVVLADVHNRDGSKWRIVYLLVPIDGAYRIDEMDLP